MNREQLLQATDQDILDEVSQLQYLYGHAQIIRHGLNRDTEKFQTQSVAEHIYNMMNLAVYFKEFEDPQNTWDWNEINRMILWHDTGELETGDILTHKKKDDDRQQEYQAIDTVLSQVPDQLEKIMRKSMYVYEERNTIESHFVKALDQIEVVINSYSIQGKNVLVGAMKIDLEVFELFRTIHHDYTKKFPTINKMINVVMDDMFTKKYYVE